MEQAELNAAIITVIVMLLSRAFLAQLDTQDTLGHSIHLFVKLAVTAAIVEHSQLDQQQQEQKHQQHLNP